MLNFRFNCTKSKIIIANIPPANIKIASLCMGFFVCIFGLSTNRFGWLCCQLAKPHNSAIDFGVSQMATCHTLIFTQFYDNKLLIVRKSVSINFNLFRIFANRKWMRQWQKWSDDNKNGYPIKYIHSFLSIYQTVRWIGVRERPLLCVCAYRQNICNDLLRGFQTLIAKFFHTLVKWNPQCREGQTTELWCQVQVFKYGQDRIIKRINFAAVSPRPPSLISLFTLNRCRFALTSLHFERSSSKRIL